MSQGTIAILISVNVLAALFLLGWYKLDRGNKRVESLLKSQKPSCAFSQAQNNRGKAK